MEKVDIDIQVVDLEILQVRIDFIEVGNDDSLDVDDYINIDIEIYVLENQMDY